MLDPATSRELGTGVYYTARRIRLGHFPPTDLLTGIIIDLRARGCDIGSESAMKSLPYVYPIYLWKKPSSCLYNRKSRMTIGGTVNEKACRSLLRSLNKRGRYGETLSRLCDPGVSLYTLRAQKMRDSGTDMYSIRHTRWPGTPGVGVHCKTQSERTWRVRFLRS
ncbi:hypothetical protein LZ554_009410 [Drepanopeziza brunnea f. sp. 'monogermtubi']|nr:hypothetical protein LZ554_009410 [Drepanopeziza brunnea f. sp. 'monogermtubi']